MGRTSHAERSRGKTRTQDKRATSLPRRLTPGPPSARCLEVPEPRFPCPFQGTVMPYALPLKGEADKLAIRTHSGLRRT